MLLDLPTELRSERLLLKPYRSGDGAWLHTIHQTNRAHLAEAMAGVRAHFGLDLTNANDAEIFARRLEADWIDRRRFVFGIWAQRNAQYSGQIWIECRSWPLAIHEIGYFVVADQIGKGVATEATNLGLHFIFTALNASKVSLTCAGDNVPSYRVAERCGFQQEGCLRNELPRPDGTLTDKLYYGLLKAEFATQQQRSAT
jgi:RimJ/RimL family protein N-acetyltransferase